VRGGGAMTKDLEKAIHDAMALLDALADADEPAALTVHSMQARQTREALLEAYDEQKERERSE
jgi:hypothetical protein